MKNNVTFFLPAFVDSTKNVELGKLVNLLDVNGTADSFVSFQGNGNYISTNGGLFSISKDAEGFLKDLNRKYKKRKIKNVIIWRDMNPNGKLTIDEVNHDLIWSNTIDVEEYNDVTPTELVYDIIAPMVDDKTTYDKQKQSITVYSLKKLLTSVNSKEAEALDILDELFMGFASRLDLTRKRTNKAEVYDETDFFSRNGINTSNYNKFVKVLKNLQNKLTSVNAQPIEGYTFISTESLYNFAFNVDNDIIYIGVSKEIPFIGKSTNKWTISNKDGAINFIFNSTLGSVLSNIDVIEE